MGRAGAEPARQSFSVHHVLTHLESARRVLFMKREHWLYGTAFMSGVVVWSLVTAITGRREAWDSELYFTLGIPTVSLVAGILGYVEPQRWWRWGILPLAGQLVSVLVTQGLGNLLPVGVIAFGLLALPSVVTAKLGALFASWME
jgi:hypothetical protein